MQQLYSVIGQSVRRADGIDKVTGKALFAADMCMDGMLYGKALRSTVPHGVLEALDVEAARALPGVHAVLTAADIPGANSHGIIMKDEPVCVPIGGKVRRVGDPLALVAAETEAIAAEAVRRIRVSIRELPPVFDMFEAIKPETPRLYDHPNALNRHIEKGDVDAAFAAADLCVEGHYRTQRVEHGYIEPEAALAYFDGNIVHVHVATQNPHFDAKEVARNLGIGMHKVHVVQMTTGGGFGGKLDISLSVPTALLACASNRPVKIVWSRTESLLFSVKRHPYVVDIKHAVKADGTILAVQCAIYGDTGAYASFGPGVLTRAAVHCTGPYNIPNVRTDAYTVFTNNPTSGAMRGFGVPQMSFVVESQMDCIAEKLGLSPYALRYKNALRPGDAISTGSVLRQSVGIVKTLEAVRTKAREVFHLDVAAPHKREQTNGKRRGFGFGCMMYGCGNTGLPNPSGAFVDILDDGTVRVLTGCAEIGQGSSTVLGQIAAQEIGVPFEDVLVLAGDTSQSPDAGASSASRQTYISGNAVQRAAREAKTNIYTMAAEMLGVPVDALVGENGVIRAQPLASGQLSDCQETCQSSLGLAPVPAPNPQGTSVTFKEAVAECRAKGIMSIGSGWFNPPTTSLDPVTGQGDPYGCYAFASQLAEVEVDTETGEVRLLQVVAAHDVGKSVNPMHCEGQIQGGIIMGMGYTLLEEALCEKGKIRTEDLNTYLMATSMDVPIIHPLIVEDNEKTGPFGAKGIGEPALIPTSAAVVNAIFDAVGVRVRSLPITPEKMLTLLKKVQPSDK